MCLYLYIRFVISLILARINIKFILSIIFPFNLQTYANVRTCIYMLTYREFEDQFKTFIADWRKRKKLHIYKVIICLLTHNSGFLNNCGPISCYVYIIIIVDPYNTIIMNTL